jgi:hypothetical protein
VFLLEMLREALENLRVSDSRKTRVRDLNCQDVGRSKDSYQ